MHPQKILLCWEQGHNLGHITRLISLAEHVARSGFEPVLALPQHHIRTPILAGLPYQCIPAPALHTRPTPTYIGTKRPKSFADILLAFGFGNAEQLKPQILAWMQVYDRIQPKALIIDYAPAAQLTAFICQLPAMQITNGFDAPPFNCPIFDLGVRGPYLEKINSQTIHGIDTALQTLATQLGCSLRLTLHSLLQYPTIAYECIAETDIYNPRSDPCPNYIGPIVQPFSSPQLPTVQWPAGNAPKVLIYLRRQQVVNTVLHALKTINSRAIVICPEASDELIAEHTSSVIVVRRNPIALPAVLAQADAVVNYGSSSLSSQTLLAGKPQLCVPTDAEKWLLSNRIAKQGLALVSNATESSRHCLEILQYLLNNSDIRARTRHIANNYKNTNWGAVQFQYVQQFIATATTQCQPSTNHVSPENLALTSTTSPHQLTGYTKRQSK